MYDENTSEMCIFSLIGGIEKTLCGVCRLHGVVVVIANHQEGALTLDRNGSGSKRRISQGPPFSPLSHASLSPVQLIPHPFASIT
jgi:hypothetical protein